MYSINHVCTKTKVLKWSISYLALAVKILIGIVQQPVFSFASEGTDFRNEDCLPF